MTNATPSDLPRWLSFGLPIGSYVAVAIAGFVDPPLFQWLVAKDFAGGLLEQATVALLLPAIAAGVTLVVAHRARLQSRAALRWVALCTAACVYFAGEEISWGQWIFHWQTPAFFQAINSQRETNLHNTSYWLNHGPTMIVNGWIASSALLAPLFRHWYAWPTPQPGSFAYAFWPTPASIPAVAMSWLAPLPAAIAVWLGFPEMFKLGRGEIIEYLTAMFFCLYLVSLWWRIRQLGLRRAAHFCSFGS